MYGPEASGGFLWHPADTNTLKQLNETHSETRLRRMAIGWYVFFGVVSIVGGGAAGSLIQLQDGAPSVCYHRLWSPWYASHLDPLGYILTIEGSMCFPVVIYFCSCLYRDRRDDNNKDVLGLAREAVTTASGVFAVYVMTICISCIFLQDKHTDVNILLLPAIFPLLYGAKNLVWPAIRTSRSTCNE